VVLPSRRLTSIAAFLAPLARPLLPSRIRALVPRGRAARGRLPEITEPAGEVRGTVALLSGCVQDRWFRRVNIATIRVLARNGWRVVVPRAQTCCGALAAHNGHLGTARRLAEKNAAVFASVDHVIVNAAGCGAHMGSFGDLGGGTQLPVRDVMEFLHTEGRAVDAGSLPQLTRVAYHDACHALRVQKIRHQPRELLDTIGNVELVDIPDGDRCCGAAGIYNVTEREMSGRLMREKAAAVVSTGATVVASGNPGCTMQLLAGIRERGVRMDVVHPIELLDAATREP
jgi:glycolate oxidase iron-sulfur subunit